MVFWRVCKRYAWHVTQKNQDDFVVATGTTNSVKEFLEIGFDRVGLKYEYYLVIDKHFFRPV